MSRQTRALRRKIIQRRRIFLGILIFLVLIVILIGYYRSNQSLILQEQDYLNSISGQLYFLRDCDYLEIDGFSNESLAVPEGTKVSGYDILTNAPMVINQEYLNSQIEGINTLINDATYDNWDDYSLKMRDALANSGALNQESYKFFRETARYSPESREELERDKTVLSALNTGQAEEINLIKFGIMKTGYVFSSVSDYDRLACEAVLGSLSLTMLNGISKLSTQENAALRVINNDHCYAVIAVDDNIPIQGEEQLGELKAQYQQGLNNSQYYSMLITRVDRLRQYPEISFKDGDKNYPAYLVDITQDSGKKILVLMVKDYLSELVEFNKLNCLLNTQDYKAWIVPQSSIIKRDDKTYLQLLQKGYFTNEVEVNVALYDKGKAILKRSDNPNISDGMTIKIYP